MAVLTNTVASVVDSKVVKPNEGSDNAATWLLDHSAGSGAYNVDHWTFTSAANDQIQLDLINRSSTGIQFDLTGPNGWQELYIEASTGKLITYIIQGR